MIEIDVVAMREEGLARFRASIEKRIQSGVMPDEGFVQSQLLRAMEPILKAIVGADAKPEDHIKIHIRTGTSPEGQLITFTEAEGLTPLGGVVVESFMDLDAAASA